MPGGKPKFKGAPPRKRWNPNFGSPNFGSPNFNSAKRKKPNEEEGDEVPIETLFRILCPIRKIGSVLGRGGDIIKSLRAETNAKILVADAVPGSDDRVIIVYSHVSDWLKDPEQGQGQDQDQDQDHDKDPGDAGNPTSTDESNGDGLKPLCPAQDALLKVNDRIAADEILHGGGEELEVAARILIPRNQAGCVIGKGGTIIQQLRAETGAGIRVLPPDTLPPCAMRSDELVQISGIPSLVKKALYQISTYLHVNPRKENPPLKELIYASTYGGFQSPQPPYENPMWGPPSGPPGPPPPPPSWGYDPYRSETSGYGYGSGGYNKGRSDKYEDFILRLLCPAWRIGGVIGKRGSHVRQLEEETGAHLQVEETTEADERVLAISAKETLAEPVSQVIKALVQLQSHTTPSDEGPVVTKLIVPAQRVGCIIGEGGTIISEMRRRTGAGIRVYTKEMRPNFLSPDDELVEITGTPHTAREALIDVCTRLRTRTLRSGDTMPAPALSYEYPPAEGAGYPPPPAGSGYPPLGPGYPPATHGYPPPNPGYPPPTGAYPPPSGSYPPDVSAYPPQPGGYPPPSSGYPPPPASGYPPPDGGYGGYPPADRAYAPPAEGGYPPANTGYPASGAYPPANGSYPPPTASGYPPASGYPQASPTAGYSQPPPGGEYPPAGTGYLPPTGGYPPTASGYAPPAPDAGYPQATHGYHPPGDSGYPPADGGYPPPASQGPGKSPGSGSVPPTSSYHGYPQPAAGYDSTQVGSHVHESQGYSAQPPPTGYHNANGSFEIRIPTASVESVIGADGANISEIRKISGAKVNVHDPPPGVSECVMEIQGSSEQIQAAQGLIHAYVAQQNQPQSEVPGKYQAPATWS